MRTFRPVMVLCLLTVLATATMASAQCGFTADDHWQWTNQNQRARSAEPYPSQATVRWSAMPSIADANRVAVLAWPAPDILVQDMVGDQVHFLDRGTGANLATISLPQPSGAPAFGGGLINWTEDVALAIRYVDVNGSTASDIVYLDLQSRSVLQTVSFPGRIEAPRRGPNGELFVEEVWYDQSVTPAQFIDRLNRVSPAGVIERTVELATLGLDPLYYYIEGISPQGTIFITSAEFGSGFSFASTLTMVDRNFQLVDAGNIDMGEDESNRFRNMTLNSDGTFLYAEPTSGIGLYNADGSKNQVILSADPFNYLFGYDDEQSYLGERVTPLGGPVDCPEFTTQGQIITASGPCNGDGFIDANGRVLTFNNLNAQLELDDAATGANIWSFNTMIYNRNQIRWFLDVCDGSLIVCNGETVWAIGGSASPATPTPTPSPSPTSPALTPTPSPTNTPQMPTVPQVYLAGFAETDLSAGSAGDLEVVALGSDSGMLPAAMEVRYSGMPLLTLTADTPGPNLFGGTIPIPEPGLPAGRYELEVVAVDSNAVESPSWPYLTVAP